MDAARKSTTSSKRVAPAGSLLHGVEIRVDTPDLVAFSLPKGWEDRSPNACTFMQTKVEEVDVKNILVLTGICAALMLALAVPSHAQQQARPAAASPAAGEIKATRDIKVISSAGARALVDACSAWAEQNQHVVAIAVLDWGGNLIESHAMEGAAMNSIDTALLKAKSALRWRRPTSETNKIFRSGENLAPQFMHDFPQPGALPIVVNGQVIGAMGVSGADGEKCAQAGIDAVFKGQATSGTR